MHELSLMSELVEQAEELAHKEKFDRVYEIRVAVGALSGVDPSCLEFCFPEAIQDSVLKGAKLVLEFIGIELECHACHSLSHPPYPDSALSLTCHKCQSGDVRVSKGREFTIAEMEVA